VLPSDDRWGCSTTASSEDHGDRRPPRLQGASSSIAANSMEPPAIVTTAAVVANPGQSIIGPTGTGVEALKSPTVMTALSLSSDGFQLGAEACLQDGVKCGPVAAPKHKEQRDELIQSMVSMLAEEGKLWESRMERMASNIKDLKLCHAKQVHDLEARIVQLGRENCELRQPNSSARTMRQMPLAASVPGSLAAPVATVAASVPGSLAAPVATGPMGRLAGSAIITRTPPVPPRRISSSSPYRRLAIPLKVIQSSVGPSDWHGSTRVAVLPPTPRAAQMQPVRSAAIPFHDSSGRLPQAIFPAPVQTSRAVPTVHRLRNGHAVRTVRTVTPSPTRLLSPRHVRLIPANLPQQHTGNCIAAVRCMSSERH